MEDHFDFEHEMTPVVNVPGGQETAVTASGRRRRMSFATWVEIVGSSVRGALKRVSGFGSEMVQLRGELREAEENRNQLQLAFEKHQVLTVGADGTNGKIGTLRKEVERRLGEMETNIKRIELEATKAARFVRGAAISGLLLVGGGIGSGWVALRDSIASGAVRGNELVHIREELRRVDKQLDVATTILMQRKD